MFLWLMFAMMHNTCIDVGVCQLRYVINSVADVFAFNMAGYCRVADSF